jgi:hypothetical protein
MEIIVSDDRCTWQLVPTFRSMPDVERWGLLFGEILHHLRAGLDNAVYARASLSAGGVPANPKKLQFPIFNDERSYLDE